MLKILQARLQQYMNCELPDVQARFRKGREPEIKVPTSTRSSKKQESSRKAFTFALLTMPKPLTVDHNKLWKILQEIGLPDHLICLFRNLYAGQEAIIRTGHRGIDSKPSWLTPKIWSSKVIHSCPLGCRQAVALMDTRKI